MGAIASINLNTASAGSVTLLSEDAASEKGVGFSPDGISPTGIARWVDRSGGVPAAYPSLAIGIRRPSQGNRNFKVTLTLSIPTLETLGTSSQSGYLPGAKVGYACVGRTEFVIPERATLVERKALFSALASVFATTLLASDLVPSLATGSPLQAMVQTLEGVY